MVLSIGADFECFLNASFYETNADALLCNASAVADIDNAIYNLIQMAMTTMRSEIGAPPPLWETPPLLSNKCNCGCECVW